MRKPTEVDPLRQAAYEELRKRNAFKSDPLRAAAAQELVKRGELRDVSGGSTYTDSAPPARSGSIDYDPDADVPGAASFVNASKPAYQSQLKSKQLPGAKEAALQTGQVMATASGVPGFLRDAEIVAARTASGGDFFGLRKQNEFEKAQQQKQIDAANNRYAPFEYTGQDAVGAGARASGNSMASTAGGLTGFAKGAGFVERLPIPNPLVKQGLALTAGMITGAAGGYAGQALQDTSRRGIRGNAAFQKEQQQLGRDKELYPTAVAIGGNLPSILMGKPTAEDIRALPGMIRAAKTSPVMRQAFREALQSESGRRFLATAADRAMEGGLEVVAGVGQSLAMGQPVNREEIIISAIVGALFPGENALGRGFTGAGAKVGGRLGDAVAQPIERRQMAASQQGNMQRQWSEGQAPPAQNRLQGGRATGTAPAGVQFTPVRGRIGQITNYATQDDKTPDSNSRRGIGAFAHSSKPGSLIDGLSVAVRERDLGKQLRAAGIRPGDTFTVSLSDGQQKQVRWDDKIPDTGSGGSLDFYNPSGRENSFALNGKQVVGFAKGGSPSTSGMSMPVPPNFKGAGGMRGGAPLVLGGTQNTPYGAPQSDSMGYMAQAAQIAQDVADSAKNRKPLPGEATIEDFNAASEQAGALSQQNRDASLSRFEEAMRKVQQLRQENENKSTENTPPLFSVSSGTPQTEQPPATTQTIQSPLKVTKVRDVIRESFTSAEGLPDDKMAWIAAHGEVASDTKRRLRYVYELSDGQKVSAEGVVRVLNPKAWEAIKQNGIELRSAKGKKALFDALPQDLQQQVVDTIDPADVVSEYRKNEKTNQLKYYSPRGFLDEYLKRSGHLLAGNPSHPALKPVIDAVWRAEKAQPPQSLTPSAPPPASVESPAKSAAVAESGAPTPNAINYRDGKYWYMADIRSASDTTTPEGTGRVVDHSRHGMQRFGSSRQSSNFGIVGYDKPLTGEDLKHFTLYPYAEGKDAIDMRQQFGGDPYKTTRPDDAEWERMAAGVVPGPNISSDSPAKTTPNSTRVSPRGSVGETFTPDNEAIPFKYHVVEASDLRTSHTPDAMGNFTPATNYDSALQPRDRSRVASREQIEDIASKLTFSRVADSPTSGDGAPIVGDDLQVESGNGRSMAIRKAYAEGKPSAAKYRADLAAQADKFGLDPAEIEGMKEPVLVRVRLGKMDPQERAKLAERMGKSTIAEMSDTEKAQADSRRLLASEGVLNKLASANLRAQNNLDFTRGFAAMLDVADRAELYTASGELSQAGEKRIERALLAAAYEDPALLESLYESPVDGAKAVANALRDAAADIARMKRDIKKGDLPALDMSDDLSAAVRQFISIIRSSDLKASQAVRAYLGNLSMDFGDLGDIATLSPMAEDLLAYLGDNATRGGKLTAFLKSYTEAVRAAGDPSSARLFESKAPNRSDVLAAAKKKAEEKYAKENTGDLFAAPEKQASTRESAQGVDKQATAKRPEDGSETPARNAQARAKREVIQKRAKPGGEYGPNGEWYPGGSFIATTDAAKKAKLKRLLSKASGKEELEPGVWGVPDAGEIYLYDRIKGIAKRLPDGTFTVSHYTNENWQFLNPHNPTAEKRDVTKWIELYNSGERKAKVEDYTDSIGGKDILRYLRDQKPLSDALVEKGKSIYPDFVAPETSETEPAPKSTRERLAAKKATARVKFDGAVKASGTRLSSSTGVPDPAVISAAAEFIAYDAAIRAVDTATAIRDFAATASADIKEFLTTHQGVIAKAADEFKKREIDPRQEKPTPAPPPRKAPTPTTPTEPKLTAPAQRTRRNAPSAAQDAKPAPVDTKPKENTPRDNQATTTPKATDAGETPTGSGKGPKEESTERPKATTHPAAKHLTHAGQKELMNSLGMESHREANGPAGQTDAAIRGVVLKHFDELVESVRGRIQSNTPGAATSEEQLVADALQKEAKAKRDALYQKVIDGGTLTAEEQGQYDYYLKEIADLNRLLDASGSAQGSALRARQMLTDRTSFEEIAAKAEIELGESMSPELRRELARMEREGKQAEQAAQAQREAAGKEAEAVLAPRRERRTTSRRSSADVKKSGFGSDNVIFDRKRFDAAKAELQKAKEAGRLDCD